MPRVFLAPDVTLGLDPALLPLFFKTFGHPSHARSLDPKSRRSAHAVARMLWGGDVPEALAEALGLLSLFRLSGVRAAREAFCEAATDARAQGHFDDGRIARALEAAGAPESTWRAMPAGDLALRLLVARAVEGGDALEPIFERARHRLARSLPAIVPYELAARMPVERNADAVAAALGEVARAYGGRAETWAAEDEGDEIVVGILRATAPEVWLEADAEADPLARARRNVARGIEVDVVRLRPAEGRLSIASAHAPMVLAYAAAVGRATANDPEAFLERPGLTLKKLQVLGHVGLRKLAMPDGVTSVEVVALQLDDLRGLRTESRGSRALAAVETKLRSGGYLTRGTFRFAIAGAAHAVDAYVELPGRLSISDPRFARPVRAALAALGIFSPGAYGDDLTTLAPWVHPEWRWRECIRGATFDELVAAGTLVRASGKETGARVAHEASRSLAGNLRAFPLKSTGDEGRHYAVAADPAVRARTVAERDLVMWRLVMPARRARLRESMGLAEGDPIALPKGVGDVGRLQLGGGVALRFVEIVRAIGEGEAKRVARAIRRAVSKEHAVVLVPEGKTLGGVLAEVPIDLARQLGAEDASDLVLRAARELGVESELAPSRFATRETPLVIVRETQEVWLGRVKLLLTGKLYVLFETLADGKPRTGADLGAKLSPNAVDLAHVVHKARSELDERVARSFREAGVELPEEWGAGKLVVKAGNRSFRLGVKWVVR